MENETTPRPVVRLAGVSKRYGSAYALREVDFEVRPGEIHALLGENGAGKSTLVKIISGATPHDQGTLEIDGDEYNFTAPSQAAEAGVEMVYQESSLVESMTVAQNLFLGRESVFNRLSELNIVARELLESHNFHIRPEQVVGTLGAAQKQMVEIARSVHRKAKVVILDEPTSAVTPEERLQLFMSMHRLKADGAGVIFITHNIEEALTEADRITVLRDGVLRDTLSREDFERDRVIALMVGRDVEYARRPPGRQPEPTPTLEVEDITLLPMVRNMSFSVHSGEVVGIAGLVGAGRSEVAMIVCGIMKRRRLRGGRVRVNGRRVRYRTPRHARRDGIVYITEDRKVSGYFSHLTIAENIYLGHLCGSRWLPPLVSLRRRRALAKEMIDRYEVRALEAQRAKLVEISGGNQQKVVLAKGLTRKPAVVVIDEPTRGVDVGSIEEIHAMIRALADEGVAVVVISSYLPEIRAVSDRILVARQGHIVAEFDPREADEETLMFAAVH
jgi:ABC-type sugar transport system ATPase subunit